MKKIISILMTLYYFISAIAALYTFTDINNFPQWNISWGIYCWRLILENGELSTTISNILTVIMLVAFFGGLIVLTLQTAFSNGNSKKYAAIILCIMLVANILITFFHLVSGQLSTLVINMILIILTFFIAEKNEIANKPNKEA